MHLRPGPEPPHAPAVIAEADVDITHEHHDVGE
eukprot:COSAG01_NODE_58913_length_303_cov_0.764706_1_plen_32_part_10